MAPPPSVAAVKKHKPKRSHAKRQSTRTSRKRRESCSESEKEPRVEAPDIDQVRLARAEYYSQTTEQRRAKDKVEAVRAGPREMKAALESARTVKTERVSGAMGTGRAERKEHVRKRRKRPKEEIHDTSSQSGSEHPSGRARRARTKRPLHGPQRNPAQRVRDEESESEGEYVYKTASPSRLQRPSLPRSTSRTSRKSVSVEITPRRPSVPQTNPLLLALGLQSSTRIAATRRPSNSTTSVNRSRSIRKISTGERAAPSLKAETKAEVRTTSSTPTPPRRSVSLKEPSSTSASRPNLTRSATSARQVRRRSQPLAPIAEQQDHRPTSPTQPRRSISVLDTLFGSSKPKTVNPQTKVTCISCLTDDLPESLAPKLSCDHNMCRSCLKRIFTMSVNDPAHMPPKCCTKDCIALKHVERIFDNKFKIKWNRKYQEYTTKNRLYCPSRHCGAWIPPRDIHTDHSSGPTGGRRYGKCSKCRTKICAACNGVWHPHTAECPKDDATRKFAEMAKAQGWQKCYNCSATVELREGCNHMTCRCAAEFCMHCGAQWKTCDCPWFNFVAVDGADPAQLRQRAEMQRRDEELARRMQGLEVDGRNDLAADNDRPRTHERRRREHHPNRDYGAVYGVGNAAGHFLNDDFVHRAADFLIAPADPATTAAADRLVAEIRDQQRGLVVAPDEDWGLPRRRRPRAGVAQMAAAAAEAQAEEAARAAAARREQPRVNTRRMAGLNRRTAEGRVEEWRQHVQ